MLEKTPKTFNARFEKEVFWAIAELVGAKYGRDKTEAVARAIREAQERLGSPVAAVEVHRAALAESRMGGAETLTAPAAQGFPITCHHCGEEGARGSTKFASICFGCKKDGHTNRPAECPVCTAGSGL